MSEVYNFNPASNAPRTYVVQVYRDRSEEPNQRLRVWASGPARARQILQRAGYVVRGVQAEGRVW